MSIEELNSIRTKIDAVDSQIEELICQRGELAKEVGRIKHKSAEKEINFYRPEREAQVMRKVCEKNKGPIDDKHMMTIFRAIMTACLDLEQHLKVAYLGPEGTFTQVAAYQHFGRDINVIPFSSTKRVLHETEMKSANFAVLPIENSIVGMMNTTLDALLNTNLKICGEVILPIHYHLLGANEGGIDSIKKVYGHELAFQQCNQWLAQHLPQANKISLESTSMAAKLALDEPDASALGGDLTAETYSLKILASQIEGSAHNETRFIVLGQQSVGPSGKDKTSLLISAPYQPRFLAELFNYFSEKNVNICQFTSRPYHEKKGYYWFYIDIEGHQNEKPIADVLELLANKTIPINVLGSYPRL